MAAAVASRQGITRTPSPRFDSQRDSVVSSAASFQTAPTALSRSNSQNSLNSLASTSSAHTMAAAIKRDSDGVNPIHLLSQAASGGTQEVHVVKVRGDTVEVHHGPPPESFLHKASKSVARVIPLSSAFPDPAGDVTRIGPPPPSPPSSIEQDGDATSTFVSPRLSPAKSEPIAGSSRLPLERPIRKLSLGSGDHQITRSLIPVSTLRPKSPSSDSLKHRTSTETRASTRTGTTTITQRLPRPSFQSDDSSIQNTPEPSTSERRLFNHVPKSAHVSVDGYLQPPPPTTHRPARRNTTGSTQTSILSRPSRTLTHQHTSLLPRTAPFEDGDAYGQLDSDILQQADQIRRERISRRRAQQEAEEALTRAHDENNVLVGNLIGEDHVNYVLMYNMLTGIRIGVSRCQAKIKRPLTDEDFTARHKFSFDIVGNELTPSAKYDFKFKDYAPWVFRELREDYFGLDPADYLLSLTARYILSELGSPGKSGSFFYFSRDYRFIIKTIHHTEHKFLLRILKDYHNHVKNNPHTLLSRFYGLHRVKLPRGKKIHFVIMNNLFPPHKDIHETYDLKGSTVGRLYPEEKAAKNPRATLKDLNWINRGKSMEFGPEKRALLTEQLRRDSELLKKLHVMDYSLLVGIHNMERGNRDNVRSNTLKVFSPAVPPIRRKTTSVKGPSPEAIAMRRAMRESDPQRLGTESLNLPEEDTGDRQGFIFYQDEAGLQATDELNRPMDTIYYLGVIDILTPYTVIKRAEHLWKGLSADRHKISPVPPDEYGNRFFEFMKAIMRGGGGAQHFKSE